MALSPSFSIDVPCGCTQFDFTDTTGAYSSEVAAAGEIVMTAGTTGSITSITVNGVEILSGSVAFNTDIGTTMADLKANIDAYSSIPNYLAAALSTTSVTDDTTSIYSDAGAGTTPNGYVVVITSTGDITFTVNSLSGGTDGNLGGWGAPNEANSAISEALLRYKAPGDTTYTDVDITSKVQASAAATYTLEYSTIDADADYIDSGEWEFLYQITESGGDVRQAVIYVLPYCEYEICLDNKLLNLDPSTCSKCIQKNEQLLISMTAHLEALKAAAENGDTEKFERTQRLLDKYCASSLCKCNG